MNISELKAKYRAGTLSKPDFIREALQLHRSLFDYVDIVRSTDVTEIRIGNEGVTFSMASEGIRLHCPPNEARVVPIEVMNFDQYEPEETRVMDVLASEARFILDVGANIGWYSVLFAKRHLNAKVFAFEPMPLTHTYLQRNIAANAVGHQVTCFNFGLSETSGSVEFFVAPAAGVNASLKNVASASDAAPVIGLTLTLDQWVANHHVKPDFIKCDVEGAELLVFRGGRRTLAQHRPVVFTELLRKWAKPFGYHPNEVITFFSDIGYECIAVGANGPRRLHEVDDNTPETNYAFLHTTAHSALLARLGLQG